MFDWIFGSKAQLRINGKSLDDQRLSKNLMGVIFITARQLGDLIIEHIPENIIFLKDANAKKFFFLTLSFQAGELFYSLNEDFNISESYFNKVKELCRLEFQNIKYPDGWSWSNEEATEFIRTALIYRDLISKERKRSNGQQLSPTSFSVLLTESLLSSYQIELDDFYNVQRLMLEVKVSAITGENIGTVLKQNGMEYK